MSPPSLCDPRAIDAARVLVVAPHPDDESLGCGGLMALLGADNRLIHTLFVTDGGASHPASPSWSRQRLAARREAEAAEALARLGLGRHPRSFLKLRDADMPAPGTAGFDAACSAVAALLKRFEPGLMLLPWRRDPHRDHRDSHALVTAAAAAAKLAPAILEYAVWLDEFGDAADRPRPGEMEPVAFDIAAALSRKRHAVDAHQSQTSALIDDDPTGFRLTEATIARLVGPVESYWRPCAG
ncbi:PIG-L deacetylase family protein [Jiella sonneratiae]|uniref:PIG-L family deacetylase n=1 Tax=Jiella sonneratiae TaxID=2816856 RepID=A0ABS3JBZ0_9HYPH|nr:PIG-L family deacetylase [Jiella sonneratiae]MBO0906473.1 PIG-L family deacetylase [Jiella sonneratiae]